MINLNLAKRGVLSLVLTGLTGLVGFSFSARAEDSVEVPYVEGGAPPSAKANECWCLVRKPATYKSVTEQIQTASATSYVEFVPAKWETKEEQLLVQPETRYAVAVPVKFVTESFKQMVKPETTELQIIPAQYQTVDEVVVVRPEIEEFVTASGSLRTVCEQVIVAPAYGYWKEQPGRNFSEVKCYCRCEVPAKFVTVSKQVIDRDASSEKVRHPAILRTVQVQKLIKAAEVVKTIIPAEYITLTRDVVDAPATVTFTSVPAKYETIQKQIQVTPETSLKIEVPAKFETTYKQVLDRAEYMVWRKGSCECKDVVKRYKEIPGCDEASLRMIVGQ